MYSCLRQWGFQSGSGRFSQHHPDQAPVGYEDGGLGILVGLQWYPVLPAYAAAVCRIAYGSRKIPSAVGEQYIDRVSSEYSLP